MAQIAYGNLIRGYWRTFIYYYVSSESETSISYYCSWGIDWVKAIEGDDGDTNYETSKDRPTYLSCTGKTTKYAYPTAKLTNSWYVTNPYKRYTYGSVTHSFTKGKTAATANVSAYITHKSKGTLYKGASTVKISLSIPARKKYTVQFQKNTTDTVTNMPSNITKYYGINEPLPPEPQLSAFELVDTSGYDVPTREGFAFQGWTDTDGDTYSLGDSYTKNKNDTLSAIWGAEDPPTCDETELSFSTSADSVIRGFTTVSCDYNVDYVHTGRSLSSATLSIAGQTDTSSDMSDTLTVGVFSKDDEGTHPVYLELVDSAGAVNRIKVGEINITAPVWSNDIVINKSDFPSTDKDGNAILDEVKIYNYTTSSWDVVSNAELELIDATEGGTRKWAFSYVFDENHVSDNTLASPTISVKVSYKHYEVKVSNSRKAFYTTSRNQNYSNGIYNVMFVGGVDNTQFPDFTSRVWWCKINDPLYFPDTNYIEVGSNDTAVQGLTKVGDYLAVIKQSKTTDTAIFLLYPTSFEEETTYAVKQGVQGVGALSRYSFNILGDETLFLSPKGVMAIVPTQDEEHKVQNRSYFVDKRLLAETGIENAYSFVFDGKYFLSIGNGHVYVLDGNQRNSWGNDRTVLVYECYFLDNVPANCFVKYQDRLVFSNQNDVCVFGETFTDAYGEKTSEPVAVSAEWSTILDDDGSLHYYKTMQKKGNLVSILPAETEETRSSTKVLVKKDGNDPVEIERSFGDSSDIPSEMFLNKKFKKYKRLQFIIRNDADEDFGVDEIVKNYTVGNYAKK